MKILKLLEDNSRLSVEQLAVMTEQTVEEVAMKIDEYQEKGILCSYTVIIDWEKTERNYVSALIELRVTPKRDYGFEEIAKIVMSFDEVESVYLMSGGYDLAVIISCETFREIATFVAQTLSPLESVLSTATHFMLRRYKEKGVILCDNSERDEREATVV